MLDFTSGIGVTSLGHCHPDVTTAIIAQAQSIVHVQCAIALSEPYVQLVESLLTMMPDPSLDSFFFWNSGSEAIEAAVKVARSKTRRNNIIVMQGSYHGGIRLSMGLLLMRRSYQWSRGPHSLQDQLLRRDWSADAVCLHHLVPVLAQPGAL